VDLPGELRDALDAVLADASGPGVSGAVGRLIERYRSGGPASEPILADRLDVLGYAAYRLPATYVAVRAALEQVVLADPGLRPGTLLDLGGGSGAAAWAAVEAFPGLTGVTVLDQVQPALTLGQRLAARHPVLRGATWRAERLLEAELPEVDLVTISYVLGELTSPDQESLVARAAAAAPAVLVVEPGTPAGYERVLAARDALLAAGLRVVAPCPHQRPCPLEPGRDWCHFGARLNRSALHRRVKGAELGYEDEKYAYICASRSYTGQVLTGRVLRHPVQRKGLVAFRVCTVDGQAVEELISKRQGTRYKAARDTGWGDLVPADV
jgi:ribosomal protein RSM22 (predicted rRNA methylase)